VNFDDPPEIAEKWTIEKLGDPEQLPLCTPEEIARLPEPVRTQVNHPRLDDRNFVEAIIPLIQTHYPVDSRRMYLSGFSGGGFFASRLTQEMSEVFAGTQTCGGSLIDTPIVASRASSYVGLIGTRDSTLLSLLEVREVPFVTTLFEDEPEVYTNYVQDLLFALSLSGDPDDRTEEVLTVDGVDIIVWTYATSTSGGDNSVKFILVRDMIHQYPNGTNHDLLAAKFTWNFFTNLSLP
jgi:poly(3-hydroxybutyrate) depolymerase